LANREVRQKQDEHQTSAAKPTRTEQRQITAGFERHIHWLNKPQNQLGGLTPVQAMATEAGVAQVEKILARINEGMAS